jgi:TPR repeat protein
MKHDVFISYAHTDADAAKAVAKALDRQGVTYWIDDRLRSGDSYHAEIKRALRAARALVVLLTHASARSSYVATEVNFAATAEKQFLPLRFGQIPVPDEWAPQVDLSQWMEATGQQLDEECQRFAAQVAEQLRKLPPEPPPEDESLLPPQPTVDEIERVRAAMRTALADGKVTSDESAELLELYARHRVSRELAARLVAEVRADVAANARATVTHEARGAGGRRPGSAVPALSAHDAEGIRADADKCKAAVIGTGTVDTYLRASAKSRLPAWLAAAEAGMVEGMWLAGLTLAIGHAGKKDAKTAVKLIRAAADIGYAPAQHSLAVRHYWGADGVKEDEAAAVALWKKAAEQDYAPSQYELGDCYECGAGIEKDEAAAIRWYEKAAEMSDVRAMHALGLCYLNGTGTKPHSRAAVRWLKHAADAGYAPAMVTLGECYEDGTGISQDASMAFGLYEKAAKLGNSRAQTHLHDCYASGVGVQEDAAEAIKWLKTAAENDDPDADAQFALAGRYEQGIDVPQDLDKAVSLYEKAMENGRDDAKAKRNALQRKLAGRKERQKMLGGKWKPIEEVRKLAEGGDAKAQYDLGCRCRDGEDMEFWDYDQAFGWFAKAAEQGLREAQFELAECYRKGHGTTMDWRKAAEWLDKAAKQRHAKAKEVLERIADTVGCIDRPIGRIPNEQLRRLNVQLKKSVCEQLGGKYADLLSTWDKPYEAADGEEQPDDEEDNIERGADIEDWGAYSNDDPSISVCFKQDHKIRVYFDRQRIVATVSDYHMSLADFSLVENCRQRLGDVFADAVWYDDAIEANEIAWRELEGDEVEADGVVSRAVQKAYKQFRLDWPELSEPMHLNGEGPSFYPLALLAQMPVDPAWTWQEAATRFQAEADRVIGLAIKRAAAIARDEARNKPSPAALAAARAASAVFDNWPTALASDANRPIPALPTEVLRKLNAVLKARLSTYLAVACRLPIAARGATSSSAPEMVIGRTIFDQRLGKGGRPDPFYTVCLRILSGFGAQRSTSVLVGAATKDNNRKLDPPKECMAEFHKAFGTKAAEAVAASGGAQPDAKIVALGEDYSQREWHPLLTLWSRPHDPATTWIENARAYVAGVVEALGRFPAVEPAAVSEAE